VFSASPETIRREPSGVWGTDKNSREVLYGVDPEAIHIGGRAQVELQDARIAVTRSKTGYILTASVPLETLGINPQVASTFLTGDVGVIFGSESGTARAYGCTGPTSGLAKH
jgi:hypothetical protein